MLGSSAAVRAAMVVVCLAAGSIAAQPIGSKTAPVGLPSTCVEGSNNTCVIKITVTPGGGGDCSGNAISLDPEYPNFGPLNKIKRVEFQIVTGGYQFCARSGDGAFFDSVSLPEDLFDVESNKKCEKSFVWKRKKATVGTDYAYLIRFRDTANTRNCIKDPWVRNG